MLLLIEKYYFQASAQQKIASESVSNFQEIAFCMLSFFLIVTLSISSKEEISSLASFQYSWPYSYILLNVDREAANLNHYSNCHICLSMCCKVQLSNCHSDFEISQPKQGFSEFQSQLYQSETNSIFLKYCVSNFQKISFYMLSFLSIVTLFISSKGEISSLASFQ